MHAPKMCHYGEVGSARVATADLSSAQVDHGVNVCDARDGREDQALKLWAPIMTPQSLVGSLGGPPLAC